MISPCERAEFSQQLTRRRGPKVRVTPRVPTSVKLPAPVYDALCRKASQERCSLHALLNRALASFAGPVELR